MNRKEKYLTLDFENKSEISAAAKIRGTKSLPHGTKAIFK